MTNDGTPVRAVSARAMTEAELLDHIVQTIVQHLDPVRIILFGSRIRGKADEDSDYDIMVEMESDLRPAQRRIAIDELFRSRDWSMDILVFTPDEVERWRDDIGMVLYDIVREGRVLYERP